MIGIDESLSFKSLSIAILTVSDTRTLETDTSGEILQSRVEEAGHSVTARELRRDEVADVRALIKQWISAVDVDVVIITGGTGLTGRDITVTAVKPLFEKEIDGFSIIFHLVSYETIGLSTLQSRACAGVANNTPIFCLPGSNGAVKDGWDKVIRDQLDSRNKPCNFTSLMPRFEKS